MSYWFAIFAASHILLYWFIPIVQVRIWSILVFGLAFQFHFGGALGVFPILILGVITYLAALSGRPLLMKAAIALCVAALIFFKYTIFLTSSLIGLFNADLAVQLATSLDGTVVPAVPPLAISFFVFEFVHYLVDIVKGKAPIRSARDFGAFALFWPTMVAGPIKRFDRFIPSMKEGAAGPRADDLMIGLARIALGLVKKFIADNLTLMINYWVPNFETAPLSMRWFIFFAIGVRILLDFSGYSDMAIGFARMMGITIPENFNWPYIATGPIDFWQRWHISLSTWIRDYIYIPLGGGRVPLPRKLLNGMIAFALCGLWHGAGLNFLVWGLYHGAGIAVNNVWRAKLRPNVELSLPVSLGLSLLSRLATLMFVLIGWLFFFYSVPEALRMMALLMGAQ